jgi:hypothetical protein
METNTDPPDEADASAVVSSFIAKHFPKMASSSGDSLERGHLEQVGGGNYLKKA